MGDDKKPGVGR